MAFTARFNIDLDGTLTSVLDLNTARDPLRFQELRTITNGTGADQAQTMFHDQRVLTASSSENLDLSGGLTDNFGVTITMTVLRILIVRAASGNTNDVEVSRGASNGVPFMNAASDAVLVKPGGMFAYQAPDATGVPVTAATGDILTITNSAGGSSVTYDIVIVGV